MRPLLLLLALVVAAGALFASTSAGHRLLGGGTSPTAALSASRSVVTPTGAPSLYGPGDAWRSYLAAEQTCPGGARTDLPLSIQAQVMVCLIDFVRGRRGLSAPTPTTLLSSTASQKATEIVRCQNFAHAPCGGSPDADVRAAGFVGEFGENLYIAEGAEGSPRAALDGWLNSPEHRENIFRPEWRTQGVAVVKLSVFGPYHGATLWVSHFATG